MLLDQLNRKGFVVGRKHVSTLMKRMGVEALYKKPNTSKKHPGHKIYPYLLRDLAIEEANQVWALDTTYIPMAQGFAYLTAVDVLQEAFTHHGRPEIVNTDQGSQFTADEFVQAVKNNGCKLSMDGRGAWRYNVVVERLWKSVKYERVYLYAYDSVTEARKSITEYMDWYNKSRPHSSLGRRTPEEAYIEMLPMIEMAV